MPPEINRSRPTPIYRQLREWIHEQIVRGLWPEHYKLKSETDLALDLGVSRGTVRKAISNLIAEGLLVRIHGRGTFVASQTLEQPLAERLVALSEDLIGKGIPFLTRVVGQEVVPPSERIASLLSIPPGGMIFSLKRIRLVRGEPLVLLHNYVGYERCKGVEKVDFARFRLFQTLEERFGLELDWGRRTFEAQVADKASAEILGIPVGDPVMYMEQVVYLNDGSPIELSDLWLRADRFRLSATVKRDCQRDIYRSTNEFL